MSSERPIQVGIIGLGRSGWSIHASTLGAHPEYEVAAVADPLPERQAEARQRFGCAVYARPADLIADPAVEIVVVATPSHTHAPLTVAALDAGRHVVVEKPVAQSTAELDAMIVAAARSGRTLAGFQPQRYAPDFLAVADVITSGRLGRIVLIRRAASTFSRRSDWQMLRSQGGGELSNNGPHYLDQVLALLGDGPVEVFADLQHTIGAGDAEDHVKVCLKAASGTVADIEVSRCDVFPPPEWSVLGTTGGLTGSAKELRVRWFDPTGLAVLQVDEGAAAGRKYGAAEALPWEEETIRPQQGRSPFARFYDGLAATLRRGAPLLVTPESLRRQIEVITKARELSGLR